MLDSKLLTDVIKQSGLKKYYIAKSLKLTTYGLQKKIMGETEFKASEIKALSNILDLSMETKEQIFFAD